MDERTIVDRQVPGLGGVESEALKLVGWPRPAGVTERWATGAWSGVMAMPSGLLPNVIGVPAALVAVLTASESRLQTGVDIGTKRYRYLPRDAREGVLHSAW
jgi:hypothetical protein